MDGRADRAHPRTLVVPVATAGVAMVPRTFRDTEGRRALVGFTRRARMIAVMGPQPVVRLSEGALRKLMHDADLVLVVDPEAIVERTVVAATA